MAGGNQFAPLGLCAMTRAICAERRSPGTLAYALVRISSTSETPKTRDWFITAQGLHFAVAYQRVSPICMAM